MSDPMIGTDGQREFALRPSKPSGALDEARLKRPPFGRLFSFLAVGVIFLIHYLLLNASNFGFHNIQNPDFLFEKRVLVGLFHGSLKFKVANVL